VESLESRLVLYSVSGNAWPSPQLITLSFMPDGTMVNGHPSTLVASLNARFGSASAWQNIFLKAAQTWAAQTNINFALVTDSGANNGTGSYQQGDPNFGDIRIGGYSFGNSTLAQAFMPPPVNNYSISGDIVFNAGLAFNNGTTYDLFTVAAHEIGHALGLYHSGIASAEMYAAYNGVKPTFNSDDIAGIRSIYSGGAAREMDRFEGGGVSNDSFATATDLTPWINPSTYTNTITGLDVSSTSDADYYVIGGNAPNSGGQLTFAVRTSGISLLAPSVTVYAADQTTVLASASASGQTGSTITVTVNGVGQGSPIYIKVAGANSTVFGTGSYGIALDTGPNATPTVPVPYTMLANGSPIHVGGGQALEAHGRGHDGTAFDTFEAAKRFKAQARRANAAAHPGLNRPWQFPRRDPVTVRGVKRP
jgi:hypothetical protein